MDMLLTQSPMPDLAGSLPATPTLIQLKHRANCLVNHYLTLDHLRDRLEDLPQQFMAPTPRPWKSIQWSLINASQVVGVDLSVFLAILEGTINTEAPIRNYTQSSRQYLDHYYPQMAQFVGGQVNPEGRLLEPGLWEKEERQHTPALMKIYQHLSGERITPVPHSARPYRPTPDPREDLYRHGLHRVATEYGATCLYLWMMVHTTGSLQSVLEELVIDEINHMTKFWGFGMWAYPDSSVLRISQTFAKAIHHKLRDNTTQGSLFHTLQRMLGVLNWSMWSLNHRLTLIYIFDQVMRILWQWNATLSPEYLDSLFGKNWALELEGKVA